MRTYIVRDESFNASMAPNGLMVVHTGLLARVHSEAELAAVLGHEFAHFERRHTLGRFRKGRSTADALAWISLAGAVSRTSFASTGNSLIIGFVSYGRDQESEADALSAQLVRASPYRLRASGIWKRLVDEEDALRKERGLRKIKHLTPGLLDSHPPEMQRFAFFAKQEGEAGEVGEDRRDPYREATAPYLRDLFDPLIKGNDFAGADYVIRSRGDALGWDAQLYFLRGELYRLRGNPRDLATARGFFQQAVAQPLPPPETWRGLGLCAMRLGDRTDGQASLAEYLKRSPNAGDAAAIRLLVEN
jgi:beta-barrel assembly-enhancing protease